MSELGGRIRELRLEKGLSQRALAKRLDVSFPHISKIEAGHEPASAELLTRIAKELGASAEELLLLGERLPDELTRVVIDKRDLAPQFLRRWRDGAITDEQVQRLLGEQDTKP